MTEAELKTLKIGDKIIFTPFNMRATVTDITATQVWYHAISSISNFDLDELDSWELIIE